MPVAVCPKCAAELDLDADDLGQVVECPACRAEFTAGEPPPPPPPEPTAPPPPTDTRVIACPQCGERVTVAVEDLGHRLRCPLCSQRFPAPPPSAPADDEPPWRTAGGPPPRPSAYADHRRGQFDDHADRTRREREWPYRDHSESPKTLVREAKTECTAAGTGLIIVGAMTVLMGLVRAGGDALLAGRRDGR